MRTISMEKNYSRSLPARRRSLWKRVAIVTGLMALIAVAAVIYFVARMNDVPANLDLSTTRLSEEGYYQATIRPAAEPIPINQLHTWTLHLETADGRPVEEATLTVDGDMPQHGHGMPTRPQVTQNLGGGDYLVEGMRFQMGGWWVVEFMIDGAETDDKVTFNLMLEG